MKPMFGVALAAGTCLLAAACGGAPASVAGQPTTAVSDTPTAAPVFTQPAAVLSVSASGAAARRLTVGVAVGGGCDEPGTASVVAVESQSQITLRATVTRRASPKPPAPGIACPAHLIAQHVDVRLLSPLGTRQVRDDVANKVIVVVGAGR